MNRWEMAIVIAALLVLPASLHAQINNPSTQPATTPNAASPANPANPLAAPGPASAVNPANPQAPNPAAQDASNPANYGSAPSNYGLPAGATKPAVSPDVGAAVQQSGLSEAQVTALLQQKGYSRVDAHAEPNSVWVWQAQAMKDGRPVTVGVDYRGNVLETSSGQPRPCTTPGVQLGVGGGLGPGAQLQQAYSCR